MLKLRYLWPLLFLLSSPLMAQKNLGRETFMANVRPSLNAILSDFYQMISLFPDFPREIVPLLQELDSLTEDKEVLRETCPRTIGPKCKKTVDSLRTKLQELRSLSMKLMVRQKMTSSLHLSSISGLRFVTLFDSELEEVKTYLDNASFLTTSQISTKRQTYQILKELDELNSILSLAIVEYIPFLYKEDFTHFYFNFVHPIQIQISKNNNYEFVNRNIHTLNFTLNLLNMNLTKRNKKTPEGMAPFLSVLHNRWNSILRYYY